MSGLLYLVTAWIVGANGHDPCPGGLGDLDLQEYLGLTQSLPAKVHIVVSVLLRSTTTTIRSKLS